MAPEPLAGLDAIDWASLTHAYGEAEDVPDVLRDISSGDAEAVDALFGTIWHQGTVYPATAPTVPFLFALLSGPDDVASPVLDLLRCIARGVGYLEVHGGLPGRTTDPDELRAEADWVRRARAAVVAGLLDFEVFASRSAAVRRGALAMMSALDFDSVAPEVAEAARTRCVSAFRKASREDVDPAVRATAVLGLEAGDPALDAASRDSEPAPRLCAAVVCARASGKAVSPRILSSLQHDWQAGLEQLRDVPQAAEEGESIQFVLGALGDRFSEQCDLISAWLYSGTLKARQGAAFAAHELIQTVRAAPERLAPSLARALGDEDAKVRQRAAWALSHAGASAAFAADALWRVVEGADQFARASTALSALQALLGVRDERATRMLAAWLRDVRDAKRSFGTAGGLLRYVGPEQDGVFETLVALIPLVPGGNDRISVIEAVGRFGARARDALPVLIDELPSHPHICTRVLGDLGPAAAPALSALDALSNHENEFVRKNVARAQFRIAGDPRGAHRVIEAGLRHGGRESLRALELCEDLGVAAAAYTAHLRERLDDADNWVAVQAAVALFAITKNAEAVVPTLLRHLEPVPSGFVALECLLRVGTAARAAEAALKGFIASPRRVVRFSVDDQLVLADERWVSLCRLALASFDRP